MDELPVREVIFVIGAIGLDDDDSRNCNADFSDADADFWDDENGWMPLANSDISTQAKWPWLEAFISKYPKSEDRRVSFVLIDSSLSLLDLRKDGKLRSTELNRIISAFRAALSGQKVKIKGLFWIQGEEAKAHNQSQRGFSSSIKTTLSIIVRAIGERSLPISVALVHSSFRSNAAFKDEKQFQEPGYAVRSFVIKMDNKQDTVEVRLNLLASKLLMALKKATVDRVSFLDERFIRQSIFDGQYLEAWYEGPPHAGKSARRFMISFPSFSNYVDGRMEEPFAHRAFSKREILTIYIRSRRSDWFQNCELFPMLEAIRAFTGESARLYSYGHSMGGFGAILSAGYLKASEVIAIAPQYSINVETAPFDERWEPLHRKIVETHGYIYRMQDHIANDIPIQILYDSGDRDQKQASMFGRRSNIEYIPMPFGTHNLMRFLVETGMLSKFMDALPRHRLSAKEWIDLRRETRKNSFCYWSGISSYLKDRRPDLSLAMLVRAEDTNGFRELYWKNTKAELETIVFAQTQNNEQSSSNRIIH